MKRLSLRHRRAAQRGVALVTSLLILVVVTLVALSMYRSFGTAESIAGNTLDKQRSMQAAESAVRYGEWWLGRGTIPGAIACAGTVNGATQANMRVCNAPLLTPRTLPWGNMITYIPPGMPVNTSSGVNTLATAGTLNDVNYYQTPALHMWFMGYSADGSSALYQVTGVGYGGRQSTVSVVQSVYAMTTSGTVNVGCDYGREACK